MYSINLYDESVSTEETNSIFAPVSISPNPSKSLITFDKPLTNARITSIQGNLIWSQTNENPIRSISISELNPGLYLLSGTTDQKREITSKFIKL